MNFLEEDIITPQIKEGLSLVESLITKIFSSASESIQKASLSIFQAGGKRLRPILLLASGTIREYDLEKLVPAAISIELLHMASLIHDDILDGAELRRGVPTINFALGKKIAIATGDFLFAQAFELLTVLDNSEVIQVMAEAAHALSLGELQQMETSRWVEQTEMGYLRRIRNKTASLFAAACKIGALLSGASLKEIKILTTYGDSLGIAFQIFDDILDIIGDEKVLGKPPGIDLRDGTVTLPIIYALEESKFDPRISEVVKGERVSDRDIERAIRVIEETHAIENAKSEARKHIKVALAALESLENKEVQKNLISIGNFITERYH